MFFGNSQKHQPEEEHRFLNKDHDNLEEFGI